jgi:hypothetical protein
LFEV